MRNVKLTVALAAVLIGCGGSGEDDARSPDADEHLVVDLRVVVRPEGAGGPRRVRQLECARVGSSATDPSCRAIGGLEPADLATVPADTACAQVYGGPATARITGELRGERVAAVFDLTDSCEIARWRRNAELLGPPPR